MLSNLLFFRWTIFNGLMLVLMAALALNGILGHVYENDQSRLTLAITALFAVGWVAIMWEVIDLSRSLNAAKAANYEAGTAAEAEKALLKTEWLGAVSEWLVGLGLLGTVIGFSVALSSIDQGSVNDASGAQGAVGTLMAGMKVALNTTLLGAGLAIWHEVNMRMFRTALGCYWIDRVRANNGEIQARGVD